MISLRNKLGQKPLLAHCVWGPAYTSTSTSFNIKYLVPFLWTQLCDWLNPRDQDSQYQRKHNVSINTDRNLGQLMWWMIISKWYFHNIRSTNYFTKNFTNCRYSEWLLVNKKVILMVDLDKNQ